MTRHRHGAGTGWYISTHLEPAGLATIMHEVYRDAGVRPAEHAEGLEVVRRRGRDADYLVAVNHSDEPEPLVVFGHELLTDTPADGSWTVPGGAVAVLRTRR